MSDKTTFAASGETSETENEKTKEVTFELAGRKFQAKPFIQGFALLDFLEASDGDDVTSILAFRKFLKDATSEEEYKKIEEFGRNTEVEVGIIEITKAVAELIKEYTSRPTTASEQ
jgi:hypothetical protein